MEKRVYKIDASGKKLGRVASQAAILLLGKDQPDFSKNVVAPVKVEINNASKLDIDAKKLEDKKYTRYSGYPSGLKTENMAEIINKKGYTEIIKKAVYGMIPGNKLRDKRMSNLVISE